MTADTIEVRNAVQLRARREEVSFRTADGVDLVGELARPVEGDPVATLACLHPLPTAGGFMDSHVLRKAAARLPALAGIAVLRFNTRGTASPRGRSGGIFDEGIAERFDLEAAVEFARGRVGAPIWLLGWSFGTELVLKYGRGQPISGAVLLSPPLHRTSESELAAWYGSGVPLVALVPEFDDYLRPEAARARFSVVPEARVVPVAGAKHLWVGEPQVRRVLDEIVAVVNPAAAPMPTAVPRSLLA